jgi:hypothetical protein
MYNIWKHCGAQDIYTHFVYFLLALQWSVWFSIILLIAWFHYGGFQGLAGMYSRYFFFLSISSTPAFGVGFQLSHNLDILQHSSLARLQ